MTPLDLCEPLFLFVCKLNRSKRKGGPSFEPAQLRAEVDRIMRGMVQKAASDREASKQFTVLKPILLAFVDGMAAQALPGRWQNIAPPGQTGDEYFFDQLEQTIADSSVPARQRLTVFYACLGLGYGQWRPEDETAQADRINKVAGYIQDFMDLEEKKKLCPPAYEHTDTRMLEPPLAQRLTSWGIILAGLLLIAFFANAALYREKTGGLHDIMTGLLGQENSAAEASPSGKTGN